MYKRQSQDVVEKIGIERARAAIKDADHVLHVIDINDSGSPQVIDVDNTTLVYNKIDSRNDGQQGTELDANNLYVSALNGDGIDTLREHIKNLAGYAQDSETLFTARRRHLTALAHASNALERGLVQLKLHNAGELLADELLQAQDSMNEITGEFSSDDLLGEIFSGFCIGK